jgi:hypothetical protein
MVAQGDRVHCVRTTRCTRSPWSCFCPPGRRGTVDSRLGGRGRETGRHFISLFKPSIAGLPLIIFSIRICRRMSGLPAPAEGSHTISSIGGFVSGER